MGDMLSTATSGLLAFQRAVETTSHNIANVNTPGYSRQQVQVGTRPASAYSTGYVGNGVDVRTIERQYDDFLSSQTRSTASSYERLNVYAAEADKLNNLFADAQSGLNATLQNLSSALQDLSNTPTSIPARQVVLSQAQSLVDRLHAYDDRLNSIGNALNGQLGEEASAISTLATGIAELNERIELEQNRTGQPPNDLLDLRDQLLDDLSTHVNVSVVQQDNGQQIVTIGNGQALVVGNQAASVRIGTDPYDPTRNTIEIVNFNTSVDITSRLTGGTVGGLLDFQKQMLDPARNDLGRMTVALAETINTQQANGFDLDGTFGQPLFSVGAIEVSARSTNTGSSTVAATRLQPSAGALTDANYLLNYNGTAWSLQRTDTGMPVAMTGAGTVASPFIVDGMSLVMSGTPAAGDLHLLRPTSAAAGGLTLLTQDPTRIAAAAPIVSAASIANSGRGVISGGQVLNVGDPQLLATATIQFTSATQYTINGGAPQTYVAGGNVDANGWRVQISGSPSIGDTFTVSQNVNPEGDNRNALLLANIFNQPVLDGGTVSLNNASSRFVGSVGVTTNQLRTSRDAQETIHNDNKSAMDSVSGVNLDEEAANLIKYQQAYQAAAQMISIAGTLFDSILAAIRR